MTCKDCVHFKVCEYEGIYFEDVAIEASSADGIKDLCPLFKNKADFVEVVRCKDCKRYEKAEYFSYDSEDATKNVCRLFGRQMQEDDFCSYGERKQDE